MEKAFGSARIRVSELRTSQAYSALYGIDFSLSTFLAAVFQESWFKARLAFLGCHRTSGRVEAVVHRDAFYALTMLGAVYYDALDLNLSL